MVHKNLHIPIVVEKITEDTDDCLSIFFTRPSDFKFDAGDWIDVNFKDQGLNGGKTYSISSSPLNNTIRITLRRGLSEYKRALQSVKLGDELYISQYGNDYGFSLKSNKSSVLIAGGIGIAPFRSMLSEMSESNSKNGVFLIYLNKSSRFLFIEELEHWTKNLTGLHVEYVETNSMNRKKRELLIKNLIKNQQHNFYISGPEAMAESNEHSLIDMGVPVRNIRIDSFGKY